MSSDSVAPNTDNLIAIVGMAGRFPGARSVEQFWRNLESGTESITRFTEAELEDSFSDEVRRQPNFVKARQTAQKNTCISNLRTIDGAKAQWALENKKTDTDTPKPADLKPYLGSKQFPVCPAGGTYTVNRVSDHPECSQAGHTLGD